LRVGGKADCAALWANLHSGRGTDFDLRRVFADQAALADLTGSGAGFWFRHRQAARQKIRDNAIVYFSGGMLLYLI